MGYQYWKYEQLNQLCNDAFQKFGFNADEAKTITDVLLLSDVYGIESHGMQRMYRYYKSIQKGMIDINAKGDVVFETPVSAVIDGHDGMGQVIGRKAMEMAIEKAKTTGIGMVVVRNSCHYGIAGYYPTMACKAGCIGMTGTIARPSVAPTFGVEGMFGTNPLTIGTASIAAGVSVTDGLWYRCIVFCVMYVVTSLFLVFLAKRDERRATEKFDLEGFSMVSEEEHKEDIRKAKMIIALFSLALVSVIVATSIDALRSLAMVFMAVAFIVGTVIVGKLLLGTYKQLGKCFVKGVKDVLPSIVIIMIAFGITYIAQEGNILHTIFHYFYNSVTNIAPYVAVIVLYVFVLIIEFFIPSASAKAVLIIPMLTLAPIEGISKTVIILTYLFADGYTNVLYPTCGTLLVGLGLADVSFAEWFKKTILFQLLLFVLSLGFLMLAVAIKL